MKFILASLITLSSLFVHSGDLEYNLTISGVDNGYLVVLDHRRNKTFQALINCNSDSRYDALQVFLSDGGGTAAWNYFLSNIIKEAGNISCARLASNISNNIDVDDFHFVFDPTTLVIKRITATPKQGK